MLKHQMRTGEISPVVEVEEKINVETSSSTPQGLKELME